MSTFQATNFELENGNVLPRLEIAYECYGEMAPDRSNVILVAHGTTSSHIAAGTSTLDRRRGWYQEVIGPGKLFDTDRYCVVSSNALGSSYGSTGPASLNPETGKPYRQAFPEITCEDIVRAQHLLLTSLGVERLVAVAGSSIGGYQAFQWAVSFPEFMLAVLALDTAPRDPFDASASIPGLMNTFAMDAEWNDGDYREGAMIETLTKLRIDILRSYGFEEKLGETDKAKIDAILAETAREWAMEFDAHSLVTLTRASGRFNVEAKLGRIKAPLLYVLCDTDEWFPASLGKSVLAKLSAAGVDVEYHEIHSRLGHYASTEEPDKWVPVASAFLHSALERVLAVG